MNQKSLASESQMPRDRRDSKTNDKKSSLSCCRGNEVIKNNMQEKKEYQQRRNKIAHDGNNYKQNVFWSFL